jgi:zinc transporter
MAVEDGLICAYALDGQGGGREVGWPEIRAWRAGDGLLWVHLDRTGHESRRWLREERRIDPVIAGGLLAEDVRPRELPVGDALLVTLRGVNLNPGADPEDMVAVRIWLEPTRIVTLRHRRLTAINDLREALAAGRGPRGPGQFLAMLSDRLIVRMAPVIDDLVDRIDDIEDAVLGDPGVELRLQIAKLRREAIALRRYLAPQREVAAKLTASDAPWLGAGDRAMLHEAADRTARFVEDLDTARERAAVVQDQLNARQADQMNRTMYLLTLVATVLLPPSLITGLLGINVGGMPGAEQPWAFWAVIVLLLVLAGVEIVVLRRLRWI